MLQIVAEAFLEREAGKWVSSEFESQAAVSYQREVLEAAAEELWITGKASLATETLILLADGLLPAHISMDSREKVMERWKSHAYLVIPDRASQFGDERAFIHKSFRDVFLSASVVRALEHAIRSPDQSPPFILRRTMGPDVTAAVVGRILTAAPDRLLRGLQVLAHEMRRGTFRTVLCQILMQTAGRRGDNPLHLSKLEADQLSWSGTDVSHLHIDRCRINVLDVSACSIHAVRFTKTEIGELRLDGNTRMTDCIQEDLRVLALVDTDSIPRSTVYAPDQISERLVKSGLRRRQRSDGEPVHSKAYRERRAIVDSICRIFDRNFAIPRPILDSRFSGPRAGQYKHVLEAMLDHQVLTPIKHKQRDKFEKYRLAFGVDLEALWRVEGTASAGGRFEKFWASLR